MICESCIRSTFITSKVLSNKRIFFKPTFFISYTLNPSFDRKYKLTCLSFFLLFADEIGEIRRRLEGRSKGTTE